MEAPGEHKLQDAVGEFCSSEKFYFVDSAVKPHAETVLAFWINAFNPAPPVLGLEKALFQTARLNLPVAIKKGIPDLLESFFDFLVMNASVPEAAGWLSDLALAKGKYLGALRSDGSIKGETVRNKGAGVGRNDPCPCGSGKKFKKCCLKRVS